LDPRAGLVQADWELFPRVFGIIAIGVVIFSLSRLFSALRFSLLRYGRIIRGYDASLNKTRFLKKNPCNLQNYIMY
jgi:hypothetical protein